MSYRWFSLARRNNELAKENVDSVSHPERVANGGMCGCKKLRERI